MISPEHADPLTAFDPSDDFAPAFLCREPARQLIPFVFDVPHAGAVYPNSFLASSRLDPTALRRSEDAFADELFGGMVLLGAPLLAARFPRAYLDVNREPYELDARMFEGRLPAYANTRSMRVAGGLGTVPRVVADAQEIYRERLSVAEALRRIEALYKPYHQTLQELLARTQALFGHVVLVDCHSMPSTTLRGDDAVKADIVLGDRYGTSCAPVLTDIAESVLEGRGWSVVRNRPYAGGFITEHYGAPARKRHALQIEVNRALYMDERRLQPLPCFGDVAAQLVAAFADIVRAAGTELAPRRVAAE